MSANAILRVLTLSLMLLNSPTTSALPTLVSQVADPFFEDTFWTARARALGDLVSPLDPHPIFIVNTIEGKAYDGDIEYKWGPLSGVIPTDVDFSPTNAYSSFLPVVETVETLLVTNISLDTPKSNFGSAGMYTPIARGSRAYFDFLFGGTLVGDTIELISDFSGSPTKISFFSQATKVSNSEWTYINFVENYTDYPIEFEWLEAGLTGTVDAQDQVTGDPGVVSGITLMGGVPTELIGIASADLILERTGVDFEGNETFEALPANEYVMVANVLTPVPLPAAAWLFGSALIGACGVGLRKKKQA